MLTRKHAEWLTIALFAALVALVFQQISTSMTEQGIASGSPYDNAAAYPMAIAIAIGGMIAIQAVLALLGRGETGEGVSLSTARRAGLFLGIFTLYLVGLGTLGYHISTVAMIAACLLYGGLRRPLIVAAVSLGLSLGVAMFFESYLKIVLPGGLFGLNIAW